MRIGMQQTCFGDVSLAKCFVGARRAGARGLGLCYRTHEETQVIDNPRHTMKLRLLMDRYRLSITSLHLGVLCTDQSFIGSTALMLKSSMLVRRAIAAAAEIGKPDVIVPFFGRNRIELPKEFDTAVAAMSRLADVAEEHGVTLAIESSLHLGQLQEFLAGCASGFMKVCLDTGDVTASRHDAPSMIAGLGRDSIAQVHIKDVRLVSGLPPEFNIRLGRGNVDFVGVANALQGMGYDGWLSLETPPGDEQGSITAAHVDYVRRLFSRSDSSCDRATDNVDAVENGVM